MLKVDAILGYRHIHERWEISHSGVEISVSQSGTLNIFPEAGGYVRFEGLGKIKDLKDLGRVLPQVHEICCHRSLTSPVDLPDIPPIETELVPVRPRKGYVFYHYSTIYMLPVPYTRWEDRYLRIASFSDDFVTVNGPMGLEQRAATRSNWWSVGHAIAVERGWPSYWEPL